jgi:DNA repair exonuclease SbcCD nuclease subunit
MKLMQISDLHLGARLTGFTNNYKKKIRQDTLDLLKRIPILMTQESIAGLIIPGDLFDNQENSPLWIFQVNKMFNQILESGKFVVYATGNHDYWIKEHHFEALRLNADFILFSNSKAMTNSIVRDGEVLNFHGIGYDANQPKISIILDSFME